MTPGGAGDLHRRIGCNTTVERGIHNHTLFAVALGDFYHTDAVRRFTLSDVVGTYGAGQGPVSVKDSEIYELVIDGEDIAVAAPEQFHPVIVVTEGSFLTGARTSALVIECLAVGPQRVAPTGDDVPAKPLGFGHCVQSIRGHRGKVMPACS